MSKLGVRWEIDGVSAAFITRGTTNGRYCVTFERSEVTLEQIEAINWEAPSMKRMTDAENELELPNGYGFTLVDLRYQHSTQLFIAELQTAQQYLGDVTEYQAQIQALTETIHEQSALAEQKTEQLTTMVTDMESAYEEGVENNG